MASEPPKSLDRGHSFTKRVSDNDTPKSLMVSQESSAPKTSTSEEFQQEREEAEEAEEIYEDEAEEN